MINRKNDGRKEGRNQNRLEEEEDEYIEELWKPKFLPVSLNNGDEQVD